MNNLLLDESPLLVMPSLATLIGLNESIVLQQVHYWLKIKEKSQQDYIDGHYWVYNTYKQWQEQFPFWHLNTIQRTFASLEKKDLLISANYNKAGFDKTKWYSINYQVLERFTSYQNGVSVIPNWCDRIHQNGQTNTIDYTENTTKTNSTFNGAAQECRSHSEEQTHIPESFDFSILKKQITKSCHKRGIQACDQYVRIIGYYFIRYMKIFQKEHPRLSSAAMDKIIEALASGSENVPDADFDTYKAMIDKHFMTQYINCDYNICHFMTEGIRNNRFYEVCY